MSERRFLYAATLFFGSGALGLGYELIWIRKAALVVGASQMALATILTSFFLGLGCGSWIVGGKLRARRRSPLVVYGLFEIGIGVYALAFPLLFRALEAAYGALYPFAAGSEAALLALRFLLLFALCLPPTFLMGGTLPLLLDGLIAEDRSLGARTSLLYAVNILGAVAGVLLTCYVAIPRLGMNGTSVAGGCGNLLLGTAALWLFQRAAPLHAGEAPPRPPAVYLIAASVSGFLAIAYQVAWARYFSLLEVTSIYSTAMLLAVYLLALSCGSVLLGALLRWWRPVPILVLAQLAVPLAVLGSLPLWRGVALHHQLAAVLQNGRATPLATREIVSSWALCSETFDTVFLDPLLRVGAVVLAPVVLLGMGVPALITAAAARSSGLRAASGLVVFWNTLGASAGAFAAGYGLLPLLGLHGTFAALGAGSVGLALLCATAVPRATRGLPFRVAALVLGVLSVAAISAFARGEDLTRRTILQDGLGKQRGLDQEEGRPGARRAELVEVVEGPLNTSFVLESDASLEIGSGFVSLANVNKHGVSGQAVQGHLPVLFFPGDELPRRCLGICLGSGQSFGALLMYDVAHLDVVDISASLVELSLRRFAPYHHGLGSDPRVAVHLDDGRHFVQRAAEASYDVVSMEPPPPAADGVYSLYSVEFYEQVKRVLTDGGVLMQWLPLYRLTPQDTQGIVKTLAAVFPETFVVFKGNQDFMTLSYKTRPRFSVAALRERCKVFREERYVAGQRFAPGCAHEVASFEGVLAMLVSSPAGVAAVPGAVYHDDDQQLAYGTGDRFLLYRYDSSEDLGRMSFAALPLSPMCDFADYFAPPLDAAQVEAAGRERGAAIARIGFPDPAVTRAWADAPGGVPTPERVATALAAAREYDSALRKEQAFEALAAAVALDPGHATPEATNLARRIVRTYFAPYADLVRERVAEIAARFPAVPVTRALQEELALVDAREQERLAQYWWR